MIPVFLLTKITARIKIGMLSINIKILIFNVTSPKYLEVKEPRMEAIPVIPPGAKSL